MAVHPNGTEAKEIALHFMDLVGLKKESKNVSKTISQVKAVMRRGYTREEIFDAVQFVVLIKKVNVYSFGYILAVIGELQQEMAEYKEHQRIKEELRKAKEEQSATIVEDRKKVVVDHESADRNRDKARRFGNESRLREKFNLDMFEGE